MHTRDHQHTRASAALAALFWGLCQNSQALAAAAGGPAAIDAGPVAITPTLGMNLSWRDNIYLQENETTDSWIYSVNPVVTALAQDRGNHRVCAWTHADNRH